MVQIAKLTARKVETAKKPGEYGDGDGLYLVVGEGGSKSWILRTMVHRKRRKFGLGSVSHIGLAEARDLAREYRRIAREGGNPDDLRRKETLTFWEAAQRVHESLKPTWRNEKHTETWLATVEKYAKPMLGDRVLDTISTSDVLAVLSPIWTQKHETAKRLRQRLSTIFDWAKGAGHYPYENPVNGLKKALPSYKPRKKNLAALPWQELPDFMAELRKRKAVSARTLEFIILTATRSWETRGAEWGEFSEENLFGRNRKSTTVPLWTVPPERMKRGVEHRVPMSTAALAVREEMRGLDPVFVFPSPSRDKNGDTRPQSGEVFKRLYERIGVSGITTHGFRSTFKDWASEYAHAQWEVSEAALSHAVGDETERAYGRSDFLLRRYHLMEAWADYALGRESRDVVKLAGW
ncbi:tyrosine-type recombinase/integrase [Histidinibacterium aquaticum]|uniref:DUF4102 domain-containing protein n=1 Tax=Histidinibacterium aquaticum TaxID=2613962 RepID=A0A5J5GI48_9RHOB|nr:integrase arm-type DNA-binding domain-containing protein [Histidinibacterium aquaticum]KAA9007787.1 DUF4102 domain-containing protein [Histidinibacterium aquaticum]